MEDELIAIRDVFMWETYGKYQNKPAKYIVLSELSDSHLSHIIAWIKLHPHNYSVYVLLLMEAEQIYRTKNMIFIEDLNRNSF